MHKQQQQQQQQQHTCSKMMMKTVRFETEPPTIFQLDDVAEEEREFYWYTRRDYAKTLRERNAALRALRRARGDESALDPSTYCTRGLEKYRTIRTTQQIRVQQVAVIQGVLDEQQRQKFLGITDNDAICRIAASASEEARTKATEQGATDEKEAHHCATTEDDLLVVYEKKRRSTNIAAGHRWRQGTPKPKQRKNRQQAPLVSFSRNQTFALSA